MRRRGPPEWFIWPGVVVVCGGPLFLFGYVIYVTVF